MTKKMQQACTFENIIIHEEDLPLSCPMPNMEIWNAHPRVYLPIKEGKKVTCPYCSTTYELRAKESK